MMAIATDPHQIQLPMCVAHALWTLHGHHLYYICMRPIATDLLRLHDGYRNRSPSDTASYVCCACIMDTTWSPFLLRLHEAIATDLHQMQLFHPSYVCCACIMDTPWSPPSLLRLHEGYRNRSSSDTAIPSFLCMLRMHYGHSMVTISTTFA